MHNLKKKILVLAILSGVLLSIPYIFPKCGWVALFAFIPLFASQTLAENNKIKYYFFYYYLSFIVWNILTTCWIWLATPAGAVAAILLNSLQMALIFWLFTKMKRYTKGYLPYLFFTIAWLAWEHSYFNWDISWPMLTLGNSFATSIRSIQWYEYTGTLGGSLWILLCNTLLYRIITLKINHRRVRISLISLILLIAIPYSISLIIWGNYSNTDPDNKIGEKRKIVIIQPNIDPYNDKFGGMTQEQQDDIFIRLFRQNVTPDTYLTLAPETFVNPSYLSPSLSENNPYANISFSKFSEELKKVNDRNSTNSSIIFGAVTDYIYENSTVEPSETARKISNDRWFDRYNTAVFLSGNNGYDFYHKSKLVIMVESTPFKGLLKFLKKFEIDLGGMIGSFGKDKEAKVFTLQDSVKTGSAICYESIYGDYYREFIQKGASFMTIITNDGWWGNTLGHKQLLTYSSLRAIETRRDIARCGNTGISAFINQRGEITSQTDWWRECVLKGDVNLNSKITIFVQYGDLIGRVSCFLFLLMLLMLISRVISRKHIVYQN